MRQVGELWQANWSPRLTRINFREWSHVYSLEVTDSSTPNNCFTSGKWKNRQGLERESQLNLKCQCTGEAAIPWDWRFRERAKAIPWSSLEGLLGSELTLLRILSEACTVLKELCRASFCFAQTWTWLYVSLFISGKTDAETSTSSSSK